MANASKPNGSIRKQAAGFTERISAIENSLPQVIGAFNQVIGNINDQVTKAVQTLDAVVAILGADEVGKMINQNRLARELERAQQQHERFSKAVADGKLTTASTVTSATVDSDGKVLTGGSYVEGTEFDGNGGEIHPGLLIFRIGALAPELQDAFKDAKVGDTVVTTTLKDEKGVDLVGENGKPKVGTFLVKAIYDEVVAKEESVSCTDTDCTGCTGNNCKGPSAQPAQASNLKESKPTPEVAASVPAEAATTPAAAEA